ncbi:hypothetical protein L211DRAFT_543573 [Terfezia boudieri ATCC MYA-4762]|uniref:SWR1-complex protein 3 domain-containing protein n=1 Tax=Terfezia boudieri ATCC MYA-4762 TaxID=1051890 RepID=A0A3N4MDV3_9PEZI|nr:hypothetical protein L211DRAFT_543573 [Terfezia boudieri ATCC MYA-4762]
MVDSGKRKRSFSVRETTQVRRHSPSPSPTPSTTSPAASDVPTSFDYSRPLPTLPELQGPDLPKEWYQSIAESGLMEESLRRSREKWLSEDNPIFEKFWTKPLKKRVFNEKMNPPKESMLKIGECEMLILPHLFEIRLYGVREPQPPPQPPPPPPPPPQPQQPGTPIPGYYYPLHQYPSHSQYPPPPTQAASVSQAQPTLAPPYSQTSPLINAPVPPPPAPQCQPVQRPQPPTAYPQLPQPTAQRPAYMVPGGPLPHPSLHRPGAPSPYVHQQPVPSQAVSPAQPNVQPGQPQQPNQIALNSSPPQTYAPPAAPSQADTRPNGKLPTAGPNAAPPQLLTPPSSQQGVLAQSSTTQQPPSATAPESTITTTTATMNAALQQQPVLSTLPIRPDPVIQLLATKAATDPDLKALMRIVAGGNAGQEELKIFQQHIDELTPQANAIKARHAEEDRLASIRWHQEQSLLHQQQQQQQQLQQQRQQQAQFAQPQAHSPLGVPHQSQTPLPYLPGPLPHYQYPHPHPYHHPLPPSVKPRQAPAPSVPKIVNYSAIVFEFVQSDHGDRFAFPKNSILEYRDHGCEVLASFLILKTAKISGGEDVEYYEPVTVYLRSQNAKTLEHLQRMVPHPEVVRTYMTDVMSKRQRAPKSWPVYKLKRVVKSGHGSDSEAESDEESRPASHTPAPVRGTKDSTWRRKSSTPGMAEPKANNVLMRIGPRVKVIKKVRAKTSFMFTAMTRVEG